MDYDGQIISIVSLVVLLVLAALFAIIETSFASVSKNKIKAAAKGGDYRAERAMYVLDNFERAITTLLICTNIVHISAAAVVTAFATKVWGLSAVTLSTIVTTIVVFFAGEMLPKSIAKKKAVTFSLTFGGLIKFLMKVFYPLSSLLSSLANFVAKHTSGDPEVSVTEEELHDIIEDMAEEGTINDEQEELMSSVLAFGEQGVGDIMTPLKDVVSIDIGASDEEIFETIKTSTHSRLPVYENTPSNIIGIIQIRKYMKAFLELKKNAVQSSDDLNHNEPDGKKYPDIQGLMDEAYFARFATPADELLSELSERKLNIAIIQNRNGKNLGIITIEDILEEIVGEVYDESDVDVKSNSDEKGNEKIVSSKNSEVTND